MTTSDGSVLGTTQIYGSAPHNHAYNIVLLAEGFTAGQQSAFNTACQSFLATFQQTVPFNTLMSAINIFRVNVTSTNSGADDPVVADGGTGTTANTYFDATFGTSGIRRLLTCNSTTALQVAAAQVPEFSSVFVIVNSIIYGGSGGSVSTYSLHGSASEIAIHEMGHSSFGLADEYAYLVSEAESGHDVYLGAEPIPSNVTKNTNRATLKWAWAVNAATAIPTMSNPDCSTVDNRASTVPAGTVGLFEGAHHYHCGVFRPEYNCKMKALGVPFCGVCQRAIRNVIGPLLTADSFSYTVADDWGQRTASIAVTIQGGAVLFVNASDDPATTLPGTAVVIPVLQNDQASASLLPLQIQAGSVTAPSPSGTAVITTDNQIRYTPASGASGLEAVFSYTAKPSSAATPTSTATVRVQVLSAPGPSPFVKVFPFRIASVAPADRIRPGTFSPLGINSYNIAAGKVLDLRGFRGKTHDPSQGINTTTFRIQGAAGACATGGTSIADNAAYLNMPWAEAYGHPQWDNPQGLRIDDSSGDMALEGFDIRGSSDGTIPDKAIADGIRITYNGLHLLYIKDDGIQNDNCRSITIKNAFIQAHTAISERPGNSLDPYIGEITQVYNCLFWQKRQRWCGDKKFHANVSGGDTGHPQSRKVGTWNSPTDQNNANVNHQWDLHLGWGHKWWLKPDNYPNSSPGFFRTRFDMRHVLIRMDTIPVEGTSVVFPPIGDGIGPGSVRGSFYENVVVLWMQGGSWPFPAVPPGVSVITNTDQAYALWQKESTAWYTANGYDAATETFAWTRLT